MEKLKIFSFRPDAGMVSILEENEKLEVAGDQLYLTLSNKVRLAIQKEQGRTDWQAAADRVAAMSGEEGTWGRPVPSIMQVRLTQKEAEALEAVFENIRRSLKLIRPRLNYLFKIVFAQRNIDLREALRRETIQRERGEGSAETTMTAGQLVGAMVDLMIQSPNGPEMREIRRILSGRDQV